MGPQQPGEFKPSSKYCLLTREVFNEIKTDLDRIQRADNLQDAKEWAGFILDRLKKKFEPPVNAEQMKDYLQSRTDYLAGHSDKPVL